MDAASPQLPLAPAIAAFAEPPRRVIDRIARLDFRAVQLSAMQQGMRPRDLDQSARRDLLAVLRRHELTLAGIDLWIPPEHFLDPAHISRAVDATLAAIAMAGELGRVPLSMYLPQPHEGSDQPHDAEAMQAITHAAQQQGVAIADHTAPPQPNREPIGIGIDPPAYLSQSLDPVSAVSANAQHLIAARLSDLSTTGHRCPIGEPNGRLDVTAYRFALSVSGYDRPVIVDAAHWPQPWQGLQRTAATWAGSVGVR